MAVTSIPVAFNDSMRSRVASLEKGPSLLNTYTLISPLRLLDNLDMGWPTAWHDTV